MPNRKTAKKRVVKKSKNRLLLSYPLVIFLMLCAGVYLSAWTLRANAQNILTDTILEPPVTATPTITTPVAGTHFSAVPVVVAGSCPPKAAYIEVFRNNFMGGSALCSTDGTFEVQMDLSPGANSLSARGFNATDNEGPASPATTVYYDVPKTSEGLNLETAFVYKGYYTGQTVDWPLDISGGNPPYAFNIDWGDGSNSVISRKSPGSFNAKHTYASPGGYKGEYVIKAQGSDTEGRYSYLEFFVLVNSKDSQVAGSIYLKSPPAAGNFSSWLWVAWPVYVSVFLMVIAYKLGEREEFLILKRRHLLRRS